HGARWGLTREAPSRARYHSILAVLPVAHEQTCVELPPRGSRERPVDAVGEEARRSALVWSDFNHRFAADGIAPVHSRRCGEAQEFRARVHVPLPADGGHRVTAGKQEAIAWMSLWPYGGIGRRAIHHGDDATAATVRQFDDTAAIRPGTIRRQKERSVGRELDQSGCSAWRELQVADLRVRWVQGIDCEVRLAVHLLVGAHPPEVPAPGIGPARRYLKLGERHLRRSDEVWIRL